MLMFPSMAPDMAVLNLEKLQQWIENGRIDPTKQITVKEMHDSGLVARFKDGIKLLGRGKETFNTPIDILVSRASESAINAIEQAGGKIMTRYYTKQSIQRLIKGESVSSSTPLPTGPEHVESVLEETRKRPFLYRLPDPTSRRDIEYYRDPAHRGYLSHTLQPGESPSLYFKVPSPTRRVSHEAIRKKKEEDADRIF